MDQPIHLPPSKDHTESSVTCPVWITQSTLDGLYKLMAWLEGYEGAGKPKPPGSFELVMFYRTILSSIRSHKEKP